VNPSPTPAERPESLVTIDRVDDVSVVTLARPDKANALDADLAAGLLAAVRQVAADGARAAVITGAGTAFSAGGDVRTIQDMQDPDTRAAVLDTHGQLFWEMLRLPIPTVSAVNGPAVGAGATVALLADLVVMAEDAYLSDPRVALGLLDGAGGLIIWPLLTSLSAAREHLLLGDRVSAPEAHRLGLVNRVATTQRVVLDAIELAQRLAALPAQAVRQTRRLLNAPLEAAAEGLLDDCSAAEIACFDSDEHRNRLDDLIVRIAAREERKTP
jgi:enoyl-CoA hydratase